MTDDKETKQQPAGVPVEHAIVPVPFQTMQAITNYLTTKPYNEVSQFIQALSQIKAVDGRLLENQEG